MFGGIGAAPTELASVFTSGAGAERLRGRWPGRVATVREARTVRKRDLVRNGATPDVHVDPEAERVFVDEHRWSSSPPPSSR